ncbi:Dps family protein [Vagococcus salmoninarum]|uniref:Dps family protein n=1 Tax=Vagococcus salmoninarum TaxID=2739 RepID=UPI003F9C0F91
MSYPKTQVVLNQLVADLSQFATMIHQTHWYMRGNDFLTLHPQMDEFMDVVNDQLDEVAERLITIGGAPYSTLTEFATHTKLTSEKGSYDKELNQRIEDLITGYRYFQGLFAEGIEVAGEEGDQVTEDLLIDFKGSVEKTIWMLTAKLGREPGI